MRTTDDQNKMHDVSSVVTRAEPHRYMFILFAATAAAAAAPFFVCNATFLHEGRDTDYEYESLR